MALLKIKCPECGAGLKSPTGFTVGQTVPCPKCETYFSVEDPEDDNGKRPVKTAVADDDDYETPRKKRKNRDDDDEEVAERSYKNSPMRFVILGVLLVVLGVLVALFIQKKMKEGESAQAKPTPEPEEPLKLLPLPPPPVGVGGGGGPRPKGPNPKQPGKGPNVGGGPVDVIGGLLGGGPRNPAEAEMLTTKYKTALVGTWNADLGNGVTEELTYTADGSYTATRKGSAPASATGKYTVTGLSGGRGLKLELTTATGKRTITAVFEDEELLHPSLQPGVTGTFRKK